MCPAREPFREGGCFTGISRIFPLCRTRPSRLSVAGILRSRWLRTFTQWPGRSVSYHSAGLAADPAITERVKCFENLHIYEDHRVLEMAGGSSLAGITTRRAGEEETKNIPVSGVFISIGLQPNTFCVSHLVKSNERGEIVIGPDCSTSCPGLFAAGDVTSAFGKRIIIASGEGAKAALAAKQYLLGRGKMCA
jgi:alkyl hydroperoxide reductase subunit AhpF